MKNISSNIKNTIWKFMDYRFFGFSTLFLCSIMAILFTVASSDAYEEELWSPNSNPNPSFYHNRFKQGNSLASTAAKRRFVQVQNSIDQFPTGPLIAQNGIYLEPTPIRGSSGVRVVPEVVTYKGNAYSKLRNHHSNVRQRLFRPVIPQELPPFPIMLEKQRSINASSEHDAKEKTTTEIRPFFTGKYPSDPPNTNELFPSTVDLGTKLAVLKHFQTVSMPPFVNDNRLKFLPGTDQERRASANYAKSRRRRERRERREFITFPDSVMMPFVGSAQNHQIISNTDRFNNRFRRVRPIPNLFKQRRQKSNEGNTFTDNNLPVVIPQINVQPNEYIPRNTIIHPTASVYSPISTGGGGTAAKFAFPPRRRSANVNSINNNFRSSRHRLIGPPANSIAGIRKQQVVIPIVTVHNNIIAHRRFHQNRPDPDDKDYYATGSELEDEYETSVGIAGGDSVKIDRNDYWSPYFHNGNGPFDVNGNPISSHVPSPSTGNGAADVHREAEADREKVHENINEQLKNIPVFAHVPPHSDQESRTFQTSIGLKTNIRSSWNLHPDPQRKRRVKRQTSYILFPQVNGNVKNEFFGPPIDRHESPLPTVHHSFATNYQNPRRLRQRPQTYNDNDDWRPLIAEKISPSQPKSSFSPPNGGNCSYVEACWERKSERTLINAIMFIRQMGLSCGECLQLCVQTWNRLCQSVTYDYTTGVCDLFDIAGIVVGETTKLAYFKNRDHFRPSWNPSCSSPSCPEGKMLVEGRCEVVPFEPRSVRVLETGIISGFGLKPLDLFRRAAQSEGFCNLDIPSNCWTAYSQAAIASGVMFLRASDSSCDQCLQKCIQSYRDPKMPNCLSLSFDHRWRICDLYAINGTEISDGGGGSDYFIIDYAGRDYISLKSTCRTIFPSPNREKGFSAGPEEPDIFIREEQNISDNSFQPIPFSSGASLSSSSNSWITVKPRIDRQPRRDSRPTQTRISQSNLSAQPPSPSSEVNRMASTKRSQTDDGSLSWLPINGFETANGPAQVPEMRKTHVNGHPQIPFGPPVQNAIRRASTTNTNNLNILPEFASNKHSEFSPNFGLNTALQVPEIGKTDTLSPPVIPFGSPFQNAIQQTTSNIINSPNVRTHEFASGKHSNQESNLMNTQKSGKWLEDEHDWKPVVDVKPTPVHPEAPTPPTEATEENEEEIESNSVSISTFPIYSPTISSRWKSAENIPTNDLLGSYFGNEEKQEELQTTKSTLSWNNQPHFPATSPPYPSSFNRRSPKCDYAIHQNGLSHRSVVGVGSDGYCPKDWFVGINGECLKYLGPTEQVDYCEGAKLCQSLDGTLLTNFSLSQVKTLKPFLAEEGVYRWHTDGIRDAARGDIWVWGSSGKPIDGIHIPLNSSGDCLDALYSPLNDILSFITVECHEPAPILCYRYSPDGCDQGHVARWTKYPNMELLTREKITLYNMTRTKCLATCRSSLAKTGGKCQSFVWKRNECTMYAVNQTNVPVAVSPDHSYYEMACFPENLVAKTNLIWVSEPQMMLIGVAMKGLEASSLQQCQLFCLQSRSRFNAPCNSAMFYYDTSSKRNCILNSETRRSQPGDSFIPENLSKMIYFEITSTDYRENYRRKLYV